MGEVEGSEQPVAIFLFHRPLRVAKRDGPRDLVAEREHVAAGVGADAADGQHPADEALDNADDRAEQPHQEADDRGHTGGHRLGHGDRQRLGEHLAEHEHEHRHGERGERYAGRAEQASEQCRGERGREDVDHVVAEQQSADHPLAVVGHIERGLGTFGSLVGLGPKDAPGGGRERRLGAGKECREREQPEDRKRGQPDVRIEQALGHRWVGRG